MKQATIAVDFLVGREAHGPVLTLNEPLSFWGGFSTGSGRIVNPEHPQYGASLTGKIVLMRAARGSSSSTSVLLEAVRLGTAPAALVMEVCDVILSVGAAAAIELYGSGTAVARVDSLPDIADSIPVSLVSG